jgi:predicted transcriptional regulator
MFKYFYHCITSEIKKDITRRILNYKTVMGVINQVFKRNFIQKNKRIRVYKT